MRAIFTYHSLDDSGSPISVKPSAFREHITWLASRAVRVVSLRDLVLAPDTSNAVALTFDDGFENFATNAWPLLREHRFPATLFVVTGRVGLTNAWRGRDVRGIPTLPLLDWTALERLVAEGLEIGGHTRSHPSLSSLDPSQTADEVNGCRDSIRARLGTPCDSFAYPYGDAPVEARRLVGHTYANGCTTAHGVLAPTDVREALPRMDMYYFQQTGALEGWGTQWFRARIAGRRALRRVRSMIGEADGRRWTHR